MSGITIVIPIFNALEHLRPCVDSIIKNTNLRYRLLLIDDHSTDVRVSAFLLKLENVHPEIGVVTQGKNCGYTATINNGIRLADRDDVVLLNSDTQVTARWLSRLAGTAHRELQVATVTPLSNAAGAFSVPCNNKNNKLPIGCSIGEMAALVDRLSDRIHPKVPTGNGFCMFIRRAALDEVGLFDEVAFPQGCGEENDFCMRARHKGFVHLIDDTTLIYHHLSASLGWRKRWLRFQGEWTIRRRYPEYRSLVAAWLANDPLDPLRRRLQGEIAHFEKKSITSRWSSN